MFAGLQEASDWYELHHFAGAGEVLKHCDTKKFCQREDISLSLRSQTAAGHPSISSRLSSVFRRELLFGECNWWRDNRVKFAHLRPSSLPAGLLDEAAEKNKLLR